MYVVFCRIEPSHFLTNAPKRRDRALAMAADSEVPMHLRQPAHTPLDQDCDDLEKIVVTPVYRGRLEESHERTRRAWRRRPWYQVTYARWSRDANGFIENNGQVIVASLTYVTGAIMVLVLLGISLRVLLRQMKKKSASTNDVRAAAATP